MDKDNSNGLLNEIDLIIDNKDKTDDIIFNYLNQKFDPEREYESNPFDGKVKFKISTDLTKVQNTEQILLDPITKTKKSIVLAAETNYDRTPFIKFYSVTFMENLSKAALTILVYICEIKLEYNSNKVEFDAKTFAKKYKYKSLAQVYNAVKELRTNQVLAKTKFNGIYYINSNLFFKGERRFAIWKELNKKD